MSIWADIQTNPNSWAIDDEDDPFEQDFPLGTAIETDATCKGLHVFKDWTSNVSALNGETDPTLEFNLDESTNLTANFIKGSEVAKIQWLKETDPDVWEDCDDTMYVLQGTSLTLRAVKSSPTVAWPCGKPAWSGTANGATGTGDQVAVSFPDLSTSTTDFKTATAESDNTKTVKFVVYVFNGIVEPVDNFPNRWPDRLGVAEEVILDCEIQPSGITPSDLGGLKWFHTSGFGSLRNADDSGTALFKAAIVAAIDTLALRVLGGPNEDTSWTTQLETIAPSMYLIDIPSAGIWHVNLTASVGFWGEYWLSPKFVSFKYIRIREGAALYEGTGWLESQDGSQHPASPLPVSVSDGDAQTGCKGNGIDWARRGPYASDPMNPFYYGELNVDIPLEYCLAGDDSEFYNCGYAYSAGTITNDLGDMRIEKDNRGPFPAKFSDPSHP